MGSDAGVGDRVCAFADPSGVTRGPPPIKDEPARSSSTLHKTPRRDHGPLIAFSYAEDTVSSLGDTR